MPNPTKEDDPERALCSHLIYHQRIEWDRKIWILQRSRRRGFLKRRNRLTSISPILDVFSVTPATIKSNSLSILILIENTERNKNVETLGLIDSGAGGEFIDQNYVKSAGFKTQLLDESIMAWKVDGTENKKGKITSFVDLELTINGQMNATRLLVTGLGKQRIILGFPWLKKCNPNINWKTSDAHGKRTPWKTWIRETQQVHSCDLSNDCLLAITCTTIDIWCQKLSIGAKVSPHDCSGPTKYKVRAGDASGFTATIEQWHTRSTD